MYIDGSTTSTSFVPTCAGTVNASYDNIEEKTTTRSYWKGSTSFQSSLLATAAGGSFTSSITTFFVSRYPTIAALCEQTSHPSCLAIFLSISAFVAEAHHDFVTVQRSIVSYIRSRALFYQHSESTVL